MTDFRTRTEAETPHMRQKRLICVQKCSQCASENLTLYYYKMRQETNSNNDNRKTAVKVNKENSKQIIPTSKICKAQVKGSCHRTKALKF